MVGLVILFFAILYLLALLALPLWAGAVAKRRKQPNRVVWSVRLVVFMLIFMPVIGLTAISWRVHDYYCAKDAGVTVYQTAEQWAKAHPDVLGKIPNYPDGDWDHKLPSQEQRRAGEHEAYFSERFGHRRFGQQLWFPWIYRMYRQTFDRVTGKILVETRDYAIPGSSWAGSFNWGFWMGRSDCGLKLDLEHSSTEDEFRKIGADNER